MSDVRLDREVAQFETTADVIARGDLEIRKTFARNVMALFVISNLFVLIGLGFVF